MSIPDATKGQDKQIESVVGKSICNHQKYNITFKQDSSIYCEVEKEGFLYTDVPLMIIKRGEKLPNLNSPFSFTFNLQKKCLIVMNYGLRGGGGSDEEKDTYRKVNVCLDATLKIINICVGVFVLISVMFFNMSLETARKLARK